MEPTTETGLPSPKRRRLQSAQIGSRRFAARHSQRRIIARLPLDHFKAVEDKVRIAEPVDAEALAQGVFDSSLVDTVLETARVVCRKVKLTSVQAEEPAAEAELRHTRQLQVARVGADVLAHDVVSSATSGMSVTAENTIDPADRKNDFPKLHLGDVASLIMVYHGKMGGFATAIKAHHAAA